MPDSLTSTENLTTLDDVNRDYSAQLDQKVTWVSESMLQFTTLAPEIFPSANEHYRMRTEFRMWYENGQMHYAMMDSVTGDAIPTTYFAPAGSIIQRLMPPLLDAINANEVLSRKLFSAEFLTSTTGEALVTLIYHRQLDEAWYTAAHKVSEELHCHLIGRARKQRVVIGADFITEQIKVDDTNWRYTQIEGSFTQPNAVTNQAMLQWACDQCHEVSTDLLELYCGSGNFTLPLSRHFRKVLATEVSKTSVRGLQHNLSVNKVDNVVHARLSAEEIQQAMDKVRPFNRLAHVDLTEFDFSTIFVDPPRAGLDDATVQFAARFPTVLYVSCNPITLVDNLKTLCVTHEIAAWTCFDQFPYTPHLECGVVLKKR